MTAETQTHNYITRPAEASSEVAGATREHTQTGKNYKRGKRREREEETREKIGAGEMTRRARQAV